VAVTLYIRALTSRSKVLEKLVVTQLVKKFPTFYETRRFITVFTRARHWSLSRARSTQSTLSHPTSLRSILISSHLRPCLPRGLFPSCFLGTLNLHCHINLDFLLLRLEHFLYTVLGKERTDKGGNGNIRTTPATGMTVACPLYTPGPRGRSGKVISLDV
jgi:hypothetical protein